MANQSMWDSLFQPQMNNQNYTPMMDVKPLETVSVPQQQPGAVANQQQSMMQMLTQLLAPQQQQTQQPDLGALIHQVAAAKDPVGYANKMSQLPSYMAGSQSPFNTGFFKTADQRAQVEADRGVIGVHPGTYGATSMTYDPMTAAQGAARVQAYAPKGAAQPIGGASLLAPLIQRLFGNPTSGFRKLNSDPQFPYSFGA